MAQKTYVLKRDYKAPYVTASGLPHDPTKIRLKNFKKGDFVRGELKHANNKPAFLLVSGVIVIPVDVIKEVTTKEVTSSGFSGQEAKKEKPKTVQIPTNQKVKYVDAALIGAVIGGLSVWFAEKQGYIPEPDKKYKLYGAIAGAGLACYIVYRAKNAKPKVVVVKPVEEN